MFGLGIWELLILLLIVVVIFGVGNLPKLGSQLGKAMNEMRSLSEPDQEGKTEDTINAQKKTLTEDLVPGLKEISQLKTSSGKLRLLGRLTKKL